MKSACFTIIVISICAFRASLSCQVVNHTIYFLHGDVFPESLPQSSRLSIFGVPNNLGLLQKIRLFMSTLNSLVRIASRWGRGFRRRTGAENRGNICCSECRGMNHTGAYGRAYGAREHPQGQLSCRPHCGDVWLWCVEVKELAGCVRKFASGWTWAI